MKRWTIGLVASVALAFGCSGDEVTQKPTRAPDAGPRFVEQPPEPEPAQERAEKLEPGAEPVDAADLPEAQPDRTAHTEEEAAAPSQPPAELH